MKFKNIFTQTCSLLFKGVQIEINGVLETQDKELIAFLEQAPDFIKIEESIENKNEKVQEELSNIDELKKYADELGVKYHPNIGADKLQAKIDEFLNQ